MNDMTQANITTTAIMEDIKMEEMTTTTATTQTATEKTEMDMIFENAGDVMETATDKKKDTRTKAQKFKDVASDRVDKILNAIDKLEGLALRKNYEYTPEQVEKMFAAIEEELALVKKKFSENKEEAKTKRFSF